MKIQHYCDAGHGWIKVSRKALENLNLLEKINHYSYQRGDYVYLEEDCDAALYLDCLDKAGIKYQLIHTHSDKTSKIRGYDNFKLTPPLKLEYIPMIAALTKVIDKDELICRNGEGIKNSARQILAKFRYESQYSKKPDTTILKRYAKWVGNVARIEEVIS